MKKARPFSIRKSLLIGLPVMLLILAIASTFWLLRTSAGASWLWGKIEQAANGELQSESVTGDLASGFNIHQLKYISTETGLSVRDLKIQLRPDWWPLKLVVESLEFDEVVIITNAADNHNTETADAIDFTSILSSLDLAVPVHIQHAVLNKLQLQQRSMPVQTLADSISLRASLGEQLTIDQLTVVTSASSAVLSGRMQLLPPFKLSATVEGNVDLLKLDTGIELQLPLRLEVEGQIDQWLFKLASSFQSGSSHTTLLAAHGSGNFEQIEVQSFSLNGQGLDLDIRGAITWSLASAIDLNAEIRQLDPSPWLDEWPVGHSIAGNIGIHWSEQGLAIPAGNLTVSGTPLTLELEAELHNDSNDISARINWRELVWPWDGPNPVFSSQSGQLTLAGNIDQWTANGHLGLKVGEYPPGDFDVVAGGGRNFLNVTIPNGQILGGSIEATGQADWAEQLSWAAAINAVGVNPQPLLPEWPGRLDTQFKIEMNGPGNNLHIELANLSGQLRGVPVKAGGVFNMQEDAIAFENLEVLVDKGLLTLDGDVSANNGLKMSFSGDLPTQLLAGVSGHVQAKARYIKNNDETSIDLQMKGSSLVWNEYQVQEISVNTKGSGTMPELQLDAKLAGLSDMLLDEVSVSLMPLGKTYDLGFTVSRADMKLDGGAILLPETPDSPYSGNWLVDLNRLTARVGSKYQFNLQEPARLSWSADSAEMQTLCMAENAGAMFCVSGSYKADSGSTVIADVQSIPVNYLRDFYELDVEFEQTLTGRLEWSQSPDQDAVGGADFRLSAGKVIDLDYQEVLMETTEGKLAFNLQNGNLESGTFDLIFPGSGFIDIDFGVLDIADSEGRFLNGRINAQLDDIGALGQLMLPAVDEIRGRFESNVQLGGSLEDPVFNGGFSLSDGFIEYVPIGMKLEEIMLEGKLDKLDRGTFNGGFRAGEGVGSINGQFLYGDADQTLMEVTFKGQKLLLTNTEQLKLRTDTEVKVSLSPKRTDINGKITIPSAHLSPSNLTLGGVTDSEDLVIEPIAGETKAKPVQSSSLNQFYGDLEVVFGDDVLIQVPGVKTKLSGSVVYSWNGTTLPTARGTYVLDGTVDVYGPKLQIQKGHINFFDVDANNPALNIRAEREIFGNTQIRSAGVQLIGTLKRPVIEAYTVPLTNEDRAWTVLVTGTDFDQGQGVGGFDVGTYIAPRLYVSYGISLFEDENVISARYDLKKGFGIKVSSGQRETGLDVSYTVDK